MTDAKKVPSGMAKFIFRRITSGKVIKNKRENKNNSYFVLP